MVIIIFMIHVVDGLVIRDMHLVSWLVIGLYFRVIGFFILADHENVTMLHNLIIIFITIVIDDGNFTVIVVYIIVAFVFVSFIGNAIVIANLAIKLIVFKYVYVPSSSTANFIVAFS
jgi:hypothetical protein